MNIHILTLTTDAKVREKILGYPLKNEVKGISKPNVPFSPRLGPVLLYLHQSCFRWLDSSARIFLPMLCFSSLIAKSACPGRIRLDDAIRYENKREIDIWCISRSNFSRWWSTLRSAKPDRAEVKYSKRVSELNANPHPDPDTKLWTFKEKRPQSKLQYHTIKILSRLSPALKDILNLERDKSFSLT